MKKLFLILAIISVPLFSLLAEKDEWNITKSTHFIVYYKDAQEKFIDRLIDKSEGYYDDIADNLGFRRYNFWLWNNRAKIYIYDDAESYQAATKQPSWSQGCANVGNKIIYTFPNARGFFDTILPHEMGHIIFREFIGFNNPSIPVWLDEGIASYQEKLIYSMANNFIKEAIKKDEFIDLEKLSKIIPHSLKDENSVNLFYAEAVGIIDFLVKKFGQDDFMLFCQTLRDKGDLEKAIRYIYPFKNIKELNEAWLEYLEK
jgi:hypothetical protein